MQPTLFFKALPKLLGKRFKTAIIHNYDNNFQFGFTVGKNTPNFLVCLMMHTIKIAQVLMWQQVLVLV